MFKSMLTLVAVCCVLAIAGCDNNKTTSANKSASPGAMPECKCPAGCMKDGKCSQGCGAACCKGTTTKTNMGAVSDTKKEGGCCGGCSGDASKSSSGASMGAVGEKHDGCCSGAAKSSGT